MNLKCRSCRSALFNDRQRKRLKIKEMPVMPVMPVMFARAHVRIFVTFFYSSVKSLFKKFPCEAKTWAA